MILPSFCVLEYLLKGWVCVRTFSDHGLHHRMRHSSCPPGIYGLAGEETAYKQEKVTSVQDLGKVTDRTVTRSEQGRNPDVCGIAEGLHGRGVCPEE